MILKNMGKSILILMLIFLAKTEAFGATIVVTSNADSGPGTLREAITVNASSGDTITFDPAINGTPITLTSAITVGLDLVIIGNDTTNTIIQGNLATQLFHVDNQVTFNGIKFREANDGGGGSCVEVDQTADVTINECSFMDNIGNHGGGIYVHVTGRVSVYNSNFENNEINGMNWGGAAVSIAFGTTSINIFDNCTFVNNRNTSPTGTAQGGAIFALGSVIQISNCAFIDNECDKANNTGSPEGAAIYARGTATYPVNLTISDSWFESNVSTSTNGSGVRAGAIKVESTIAASIYRSTFKQNVASGSGVTQGGAIYADTDNGLLLEDCIFEGNIVATSGATSSAGAAGIYNRESVMTVNRCSFYNNAVFAVGGSVTGGALEATSGSEETNILNSTFYNNSATTQTGNSSRGGALMLDSNSDILLRNNTVVGNSVFGGTILSAGGGLFIQRATNWIIQNNIFADNYADIRGLDIEYETFGGSYPISSNVVGNLVEDNFGYPGTFAYTSDPGMDPTGIQDNGGLTPTVAIVNPASEAINNAVPGVAPLFDQRNATRNGNPDIGAFEVGGCLITDTTISVTVCSSYTVPSGDETYTFSGVFVDTIPNAAGCDSLITIDLTINQSTSFTDVITACDSYLWIDGNTYTSSNNTATHIIPNAVGCDSVITLDLTVNYSTTATDVITACDSYTWLDGNTYTSSNNTVIHIIPNAVGCDSVIVLDLTINYSNSGTDVVTECESYTWIDGNTYTASTTTPTFTLTNAAGCDSLVTLNLTILNATSSSITETVCDSYTVPSGNETYTTSGIYTDTIANAVGCDSIITIDLTVNYSDNVTETVVACDSFTWINGTTYYTSTTAPTFTYTNAQGCDSIVQLDLTINQTTYATITETVCDMYTVPSGNETYLTSGTYLDTIPNAAGCDSVITIDLTVNYFSIATDYAVACDSFTWIDGNTYTSSTNTPTFTLTNAVGCDSLITLDLTINNATMASISESACFSYTVPSGNATYTSSGIYNDTIMNTSSCDSVITIDLTINTVDVNTSVSGITITADASGASYQWIDCDNGNAAISGATDQSYTPTANGNYAVIVDDGTCSDTSDCVNINSVSLADLEHSGQIVLSPNPTANLVKITADQTIESIRLIDLSGKVLSSIDNVNAQQTFLQLESFTPGTYLVEVTILDETSVLRVVKR